MVRKMSVSSHVTLMNVHHQMQLSWRLVIQSMTNLWRGWILAWIGGLGLHPLALVHLSHSIQGYPHLRVGTSTHYPVAYSSYMLVDLDGSRIPPRVVE